MSLLWLHTRKGEVMTTLTVVETDEDEKGFRLQLAFVRTYRHMLELEREVVGLRLRCARLEQISEGWKRLVEDMQYVDYS
jgi:hypothetical protein